MSASITLTLSGVTSQLSAQYCPAIELSDKGDEREYVCGLIDFQTFNSIPNIDETNNSFYFGYKNIKDVEGDNNITDNEIENSITPSIQLIIDNTIYKTVKKQKRAIEINPSEQNPSTEKEEQLFIPLKSVQIPIGTYEVSNLSQYLKKQLQQIHEDLRFELFANHNTLQCEIYCNQPIDFTKSNSFGSLLGFHNDIVLEANKWHESKLPANILKVNVIRIHCNIVTGSYLNNHPSHSIHEFSLRVPPGSKIVEVPHNVIYFPITVKSIQRIDISIVDENDQLVNFRGETITVRLHIKKINS